MKGNYIVLDCETGGLKASENPITQIALLGLDAKTGKELGRYETFVKPYYDLEISKIALEKTNISTNDLARGAEIKEVVRNIMEFCKKVAGGKLGPFTMPIIVGHNVSFDVAFIDAMFYLADKRMQQCFANNNDVIYYIDTQQMARMFWPEASSIKLGDCCERAGYRLVDAHGAMNDVIGTKNLFLWYKNQINSKVNSSIDNNNQTTEKSDHRKFFSI